MKPVLLACLGPGRGHKTAAFVLRETFLSEKEPFVRLDTLTTAMPFFRFLYTGMVSSPHAPMGGFCKTPPILCLPRGNRPCFP